jgi:thymidylate kinase
VADAYDALAAAEPERFAVIDAAQEPLAVLADCLAVLSQLRSR